MIVVHSIIIRGENRKKQHYFNNKILRKIKTSNAY